MSGRRHDGAREGLPGPAVPRAHPLRVLLASTSPRRRELLQQAGLDVISAAPAIDDALLPVRAADVARDCMALAWFKAAQVLRACAAAGTMPDVDAIVAADTACVMASVALGKPASEQDARRMIESVSGRSQDVWTGACVLSPDGRRRRMFARRAVISFGALPEALVADHLASGRWRGKAGGYDIVDLVAHRWPVSWQGDEEVIRGLPVADVVSAVRAMRTGDAS